MNKILKKGVKVMTTKRNSFIILVLCLLSSLLLLFGICSGGKEENIKIGFQAQTLGHAPAHIIYHTNALESVPFSQKPMIKDLPGGVPIINAMASGDINVVYGGWGFVLPAIKGLPVKIVAGIASGGNFVVCMTPGVNKISDLKGKTIAVHGQMSSQAIVLRLALKEAGLDPDKDVNIVVVDRPLQIIALTQKKSVDAIVVGEPIVSQAVKAGAYIAIDNKNLYANNQFPETWVFASTDIIKNNRGDVEKFLKKHSEMVDMINYNSEDAASALSSYYAANGFQISKDEVLKQLGTFNYSSKVDKKMIEEALILLKEQGLIPKTIPIDDLIDCSFGYCE